jgi:hypothetical protein
MTEKANCHASPPPILIGPSYHIVVISTIWIFGFPTYNESIKILGGGSDD